jgi:hypothetical protein
MANAKIPLNDVLSEKEEEPQFPPSSPDNATANVPLTTTPSPAATIHPLHPQGLPLPAQAEEDASVSTPVAATPAVTMSRSGWVMRVAKIRG